jgi:hypothetical protein
MTTMRIFLGPNGPAGGVPGVLADLSAGGLVEPYLWVEESGVGSRDARAVRVERGRRQTTFVGRALADERPDRVRLCVVVPLLGGPVVAAEVEDRLAALVFESRKVPTPPTRIRCVVGRDGDRTTQDVIARDGWHNVYVAPEVAEGPGWPVEVIAVDQHDAVDLARHAAPAIAGVVGLWAGADRCVFDDDQGYQPGARLARAFYRRVDAAEVEHDLRCRVLTTENGNPRPGDRVTEATYVADPGTACRHMAGEWWKLHRDRVIGPHTEFAVEPLRSLTRQEVFQRFLRFLGETLRTAPGTVKEVVVNRSRIATAAKLSEVVLGGPESAYRVVVDGVSGNRLPVGLDELGEKAEELDRQVARLVGDQYRQPTQPGDLAPMWRGYAHAALTLVDAGNRDPDLPPIQVNGVPAVLRLPEQAVPGPSDAFEVKGDLAARVGDARVDAGDVVASRLLRRRLQALQRDPALAVEAGKELGRLAGWSERHESTYAATVGALLDDQATETRDRIRGYLEELQDTRSFVEPSGRSRAGHARWLLTFVLFVLVVPVALVLLGIYALLPWWLALVLLLASVVGWFGAAFSEYARERLEIEQAAQRRRTLLPKVQAAELNLRQSLIDLRALRSAYDQYRVHNRIVGAVLEAPFGPPPTPPERPAELTYGLPRGVRVAWARAHRDAVGAVAERLRREAFSPGWLTGPWERHCRLAGVRIDSYRIQHDERWDAVFDLHGGGVAGSDLERWSYLLAKKGTSGEPGEDRWKELLDWIRTPGLELDAQLLASVETTSVDKSGELRTVSLQEFVAGADGADGRGVDTGFRAQYFVGDAYLAEANRVEIRPPKPEQHDGLSRVYVLVQFSGAVREWHFAATQPEVTRMGPRPDYPRGPHEAGATHRDESRFNGRPGPHVPRGRV